MPATPLPPDAAAAARITRCPHCGGEEIVWPTPKKLTCAGCGFVLYLNVAAAVAVIIECRGRILFGVRRHEPQLGMLDLPGGFVDPGETAEEAVRRELQEELGATVQTVRYLYSFPNTYRYRGVVYDTVDLIFLVRWDEAPPLAAADDLASFLWVDRDAVDYDRIGFVSLRRAVQRYLGEDAAGG